MSDFRTIPLAGTLARNAAIVEAWKAGEATIAIANRIGLSRNRVLQIIAPFTTPEERWARNAESTKALHQDPEIRRAVAAGVRARWQDPDYRLRRVPPSVVTVKDGVARVELPGGDYFLADEDDLDLVVGHRWLVSSSGYVRRASGVSGQHVFLHQQICKVDPGLVVDHVNQNRLDNRRANLRAATRSLNGHNADYSFRSPTQFRGVCRHGRHWIAKISFEGSQRALGVFSDPAAAALAYDLEARRLHGEAAFQNFPVAA